MAKSPKNKKPNITIITDGKMLNEIKTWADSKGLSMNALINEILIKNTLFFKYTDEHKCMIIPSSIYKKMIETIPEEELTDLANRIAHEMIQSIFAQNNISYTLDNLIKSYFESVGLWSGLYSTFKHYNDMGMINLIFEHNYDIKWSNVLSNVISNLVEKILNLPATKQKILPNTVVLQVKEK